VGFLNAGAPRPLAVFAAAFRQGLEQIGYVEGRNLIIDYRWAGGARDRLPQMAADLVARRVAVVAVFGVVASHIAKSAVADSSVPMVFANGGDPIADGLVSNLARPGGNITGITSVAASIVPKRLEFLRAVVPSVSAIAIVTNPDNPFIHAAADAMKEIFGKETVYVRSGGSIPIVGVFDRYLGIPSVMMGFGLPDDNLHAPNEKFHLPNFYRGIEAVAKYLEILGR